MDQDSGGHEGSREQEISQLVDPGSRVQEISPFVDPGSRQQETRTLMDPGLRQMTSCTAGSGIPGGSPDKSFLHMVWEILHALNSLPMIGTG